MLDLSFNKITGEYKNVKNMSNESKISLNVNRLSGSLQEEEISVAKDVNILLGNIFSCKDLPRNDKHYQDYDCGSSILIASLFLFGLCAGVILVFLLIAVWFCRCRESTILICAGQTLAKGYDFQESTMLMKLISLARNMRLYLSVMSTLRKSIDSMRNGQKVVRFFFDLIVMTRLWVSLCILSIVMSVPMYILKNIDNDFTTHFHLYAWELSWAYTTGELPSLLLLTAWIIMICSFIFVVVYILWNFNSHEIVSNRRSEQLRSVPLSHRNSKNSNGTENVAFSAYFSPVTVVLLLTNNIAVVGVNMLYIYSTAQEISSDSQLLIQLCVALFKQVNSVFMLPYLCKGIKDIELYVRVRLRISILQTLIVPCIVTSFQDPNCLQVPILALMTLVFNRFYHFV